VGVANRACAAGRQCGEVADVQRQGRILDERTADCVVGRSIALAPDFLDFAKFEVSFSAVN
jgi:hypothetical protein